MAISPLSVILEVAGPPEGQRIVDVGCGDGSLVVALAKAGYSAEGVEPGEAAIAAARQRAPHLTFHHSGAERLPLQDGWFDVAVMVNALHHVPVAAMDMALSEMRRILKPAGKLVVIEPGVTGSFFEALRPIEDETLVRNAAQAALDRAAASGGWQTVRAFGFDRNETFRTADEFIARVVAVDPARAKAANRNFGAVLAALARHAAQGTDGKWTLVQPTLVRILAPA